MTSTEDLLRQALRARADRAPFEPTPVLDVARRARELRRRRRLTTLVAAAAAVAAVGVPAGLLTGLVGGADRAPAPAGPAGGVVVSIDALSRLPGGDAPAVDYVVGEVYVSAGGGRTELDVEPGSVQDAAPYAGGVLVTTTTPATSQFGIADQLWFGSDGELENAGCGSEQLVVGAGGGLTAHVRLERGCDGWGRRPVVSWGPTDDSTTRPSEVETVNGVRVDPVGVSPDRVLYNMVDTPTQGSSAQAFLIDEAGVPVEVEGIVRALAWHPATGRVAGCSEDGRCGVVHEIDGSQLMRLDGGEVPLSFSPDGRLLASATGYGEQPPELRIRDARTGEVLVTLAGDDTAFQGDPASVAWEDPTHLLLARVDPDGEALVRLGLGGTVELATPVADPTLGGYLLPGA